MRRREGQAHHRRRLLARLVVRQRLDAGRGAGVKVHREEGVEDRRNAASEPAAEGASTREIAEMCGVGHQLVLDARQVDESSMSKTTGAAREPLIVGLNVGLPRGAASQSAMTETRESAP